MAKTKICGITNYKDAMFAAKNGAYALGFNFYPPSPRYIAPEDAAGIIAKLPAYVLKAGVFVNESVENIMRVAAISGLTAVQLHGDESPEFIANLKQFTDLLVIKAIRVTPDFDPRCVLNYGSDAILLDAYSASEYGGTGETFNWDLALEVQKIFPKVYLAGGLSPDNVQQAVLTARPYAVDACSLLESEKGRKDNLAVKKFIENSEGPDLSSSAEVWQFIRKRLNFLTTQHNFQIVEETINFNVVAIKYRSKKVEVCASCFFPRSECEIWFQRNKWFHQKVNFEERFEVHDLNIALGLNSKFIPGVGYGDQSSEKAAIAKIGWDADILENFGDAVLRGDKQIYEKLRRNREERSRDYNRKIVYDQTRRDAETAWKARDYATVVSTYSEMKHVLKESEKKRLEYALKKLNETK